MRRILDEVEVKGLLLCTHNHGVTGTRHRCAQQQIFVKLLARTQTDVLEVNMLTKYVVAFDIVSTESNHAFG